MKMKLASSNRIHTLLLEVKVTCDWEATLSYIYSRDSDIKGTLS